MLFPVSPFGSGAQEDSEGRGGGAACSSLLEAATMVSSSFADGGSSSLVVSHPSIPSTFSSPSRGYSAQALSGGLEIERQRLRALGCSDEIALSIQNSRKGSTLKLYDRHWANFSKWCNSRGVNPASCDGTQVLEFLRDGFLLGLAVSTLRSQWSALKAIRGSALDQFDILASRILRSFYLRRPVVHTPVPAWDLPMVLKFLQGPTFEPLTSVSLKFLTLKVFFLVAITSGRRLGEIGALLCHAPFLRFFQDKVVLRPDPAFLPKVFSSFHVNQDLILPVFFPDPSSVEEEALHSLDLVRALAIYLERTALFRKVDFLFVTFGVGKQGQRPTTSSLSRWVKTLICLAYQDVGLPLPAGIQGRSTRSVSSSWAATRGSSLKDICAAATWSDSNTFVSHYKLRMGEVFSSLFGPAVLSCSM